MRLISSIRRLEAGAALARERVPASVGLSWSRNEVTIDPEELGPGEYIACDIRVQAGVAGGDRAAPDAMADQPYWWTLTERVTCDPQDLGVVRDAEGERIGRVMELDGSMISIEWDVRMERA
jgi:hypothetical protein